jgi:hypothetical protein
VGDLATALVVLERALGDSTAGVPSRRSTASRREKHREISFTARQHPRDYRVRVPHLAGAELVTAPDRRWYRRQELKDSSSQRQIVGESHGARDRLVNVGNPTSSPASNLVTEAPKATGPARSNGTFGHDTSSFRVQVGNRSLLDHKTTFRNVDHQRRVVEIAASSPLNERRDRLEHLAADAHDMRAGAQATICGSEEKRSCAKGWG